MKLLIILSLLVLASCKEEIETICFKAHELCNCSDGFSIPADNPSVEKFCVQARKVCSCEPAPTPTPTPTPEVTPTPIPTVSPTPVVTPTPDTGHINLKQCNQVVGFVWKMNKEKNTAVVMSKSDQGCKAYINDRKPNECKNLDDGRPFCRHYVNPCDFDSPAYVKVKCNDEIKYEVKIPNTCERCAYYSGGWGN